MKTSVIIRSILIALLGMFALVGFSSASHAFDYQKGVVEFSKSQVSGLKTAAAQQTPPCPQDEDQSLTACGGDIPEPKPKEEPKDTTIPCTTNCHGNGNDNGNGNGDGGEQDSNDPQYKWINFSIRVDFRDPPADAYALDYAEERCSERKNAIGADVNYSRLYHVDTDSYVEGSSGFRRDSASCILLNVTRTNHTCVLKVDLSVTQTAGVGIPPRKVIAEKTVTSGGWRSGQSVKKCDNSSVFGLLKEDIKEMGRYRADAVVHYRNIVAINTYDPILDERTVEVDERDEFTRSNTVYAQKTCEAGAAGFRRGIDRDRVFIGSGWSWTHADCAPHTDPEPQRYECVAVDASVPGRAINGTARNWATLFRDGNANELTWGVMRPSSPFRQDGNASTRFYRNEDGTPWKETNSDPLLSLNISTNKNNNRFASRETSTSWLSGGPHSTAYVRAYWASADGKPTYINPVWRFEGTMPLRVPEGLSFDTETNEWEVTSWRTERIPSTATCEGPRIRLTFVRATSTN